MNSRILISILGLLLIFFVSVSPKYSYCEMLFMDNFDNHDDWQPIQGTGSIECYPDHCSGTPPPNGYVAYRVGLTAFSDDAGENTIRINSDNYRGPSGKGFTFWNEAGGNSSLSLWDSDGLLNIELNSDGYDELYVRFYIRFQLGWQWRTGGSNQQKFFRVTHYWGGGKNPFQMGSDTIQPMLLAELAKWNNGNADICYNPNYRYENEYYPSDATPSGDSSESIYFGTGSYSGGGTDFWDEGMMGDGEWHCWEFYVKLNSAVGVADGVHRFWQDGVLIHEKIDLAWSDVGSQSNPRRKWNYVMIGGNNNNPYADYTAKEEQWYAIDDIVISTTHVGPLPAAPVNLRIK